MTSLGPSIGLFSSSETQITTGMGNYVLTLDNNANSFATGWTVQIRSNTDGYNYMLGVVTQNDQDGSNNITVATFFSQGTLTDQSWTVQIIAGPQSSVNPYAATTVDNNNLITVPTQGSTVAFNVEPNKAYTNFSTVYCSAQQDYKSWFIGTVLNYDNVLGVLNVYVTNTSNTGLTYCPWTITLLDNSSLDADLMGFASDTLTITAGTNVTFTTATAGKYFPIQGNVLIDDLNPTVNNHYVGNVVAYTGNTLIVSISSVFGTGTPSSAWGIYLIAGPFTRIPLYAMTGLQIINNISIGNNLIINGGSIRDSTDTIDLVYSGGSISVLNGSGSFVSVAGAGTVSSIGTAVTGIGTVFTTFFSATATLTDLSNQLAALNYSAVSFPTVIVAGINGASTNAIADNLDLTSSTALAAGGIAYTRGGAPSTFGGAVYGIMLCYNSTTGAVNPFSTSFTPSGVPDLPAGYTYYRIIGYVVFNNLGNVSSISQPLVTNVLTTPGDLLYFGNVTGPNGSVYQTYDQRLPIGSSGTVITSVTGLPAWSSGANVLSYVGAGLTSAGGLINVKVGATLQANPTFNTSNATLTMRMMGYGSLCTITPASTGNVSVTFDGAYQDNGVVGGLRNIQIQSYYGTGTAASTGAAVTGTIIGPQFQGSTLLSQGVTPFSMTRLITGLTSGAAVWLDLAMALNTSGATAVFTTINCTAKES